MTQITYTKITSSNGPLSKRVYLDESGNLHKEAAAQLYRGSYGYFAISRAGTLLKRTIVDTAVWQPERLDFVGGAVCTPPLKQRT